MGAFVKQLGSRVSKIKVSTKQFLKCFTSVKSLKIIAVLLVGFEFWFLKHGGLVPVL